MKSAGYIKYPVDMFKWFLLLIGGDEPEAWGGGVTRTNAAIAMTASAPATLLDAVEIDVSYSSSLFG
jgi:hypothetical protein